MSVLGAAPGARRECIGPVESKVPLLETGAELSEELCIAAATASCLCWRDTAENVALAVLKASSVLKLSAMLAGAVAGPEDPALGPLFVLVTIDGFGGDCAGASKPAIARNRLGNGAFGSSVYSGNGKNPPFESTLTRS